MKTFISVLMVGLSLILFFYFKDTKFSSDGLVNFLTLVFSNVCLYCIVLQLCSIGDKIDEELGYLNSELRDVNSKLSDVNSELSSINLQLELEFDDTEDDTEDD